MRWCSHRMLPALYHPGRSATVRQGPKIVLGSFGELHPRVLAALDLVGPVVAFELDLDAVGEPEASSQGARRICRRSSRSAATSRSWWTPR